jgi:prepilin-type N-terminal cleavage/methylation domain-containing protein
MSQDHDMKCLLAESRRSERRSSQAVVPETRHGAQRLARQRRRPRSGLTLVEMLVVISVAAVMLGMSVCTIHLLLDAEREATRAVRFNTSVARLTQAFRADIHASRQVELPATEPGKPIVLVASVDGGQIRYELDEHLATRIETEGGRQVHREVFYLPPHSRMRFEHQPDQKLPGQKLPFQKLVVLEIDMAAGGTGTRAVPSAVADKPQRRLAIEAVLGRDHRFETQK